MPTVCHEKQRPAAGGAPGPARKAVSQQQSPPFYPPYRESQERPDSAEWTHAKQIGDAGERLVQRLFQSRGFRCQRINGPNRFDLRVDARIEVKTDRLAVRTGRVAVELEYRGRPAGVLNTSADVWAIIVGPQVFVTTPQRLRELIEQGDFEVKAGGDGGHSRFALLPVHVLRLDQQVEVRHVEEAGARP